MLDFQISYDHPAFTFDQKAGFDMILVGDHRVHTYTNMGELILCNHGPDDDTQRGHATVCSSV